VSTNGGLRGPTRAYKVAAAWPLNCGNTTPAYCREIASITSNP
jgi:hypothetical protein